MRRSGSLSRTVQTVLLLWWGWGSTATAHPVGNELYSLLHAAQIDERDQLTLVTILEVPMMVTLRDVAARMEGQPDREAVVEAYTADQCAKLASGLTVEINGQAVAGTWKKMDDPRNGKLIEAFFTYLVEFEPTRPLKIRAKPFDIVIRDTSFSEEEVVFAGRVEASPPWFVGSRNVPHGEWSDEPSWRTLTARFERL